MNITVCEYNNDTSQRESTWNALKAHCTEQKSDLVVLPEMPFHTWLAGTQEVDEGRWDEAVAAHEQWLERLDELGVRVVIGSRPVRQNGVKLNEGYIWTADGGYQAVHHKVYLPNEEGYWEATWYSPGPESFDLIEVGGIKIGLLICTELWFTQRAREYMKRGIDLLVCPRATEPRSREKWIVGGRAAAVVAGAYCLSSNLGGRSEMGQEFAGTGWVIEPENGEVLGLTSSDSPFIMQSIDIERARAAKKTYPRDVIDEF